MFESLYSPIRKTEEKESVPKRVQSAKARTNEIVGNTKKYARYIDKFVSNRKVESLNPKPNLK